MRNHKEERFFTAVIFNIVYCKIINAITPNSLKIDSIIVFIKQITSIDIRGKLQTVCGKPIIIITAPKFRRYSFCLQIVMRFIPHSVGCQMPFSYIGCIVILFIKALCQSIFVVCIHRNAVYIAIVFTCKKPCLDARPCRSAYRLTCIAVIKKYTLVEHSVYIWSYFFVDCIKPLLVAKIKNYIHKFTPYIIILVIFYYIFRLKSIPKLNFAINKRHTKGY